jgi:hypothetical protein
VIFGREPQSPYVQPGDAPRPLRRGVIEEARTTRADVSLVLQPEPGAWSLVARHSLEGTAQTFVAVARFTLAAEGR